MNQEQLPLETCREIGHYPRYTKQPPYPIYNGMIQRCHNPKNKFYPDYGGRGILVCEEWRNDFLVFKAWAEANGYSNNLDIDRIDNDKGYYPENCRFVERKINCRNRRSTKLTQEKVDEIRERLAKGEKQRMLAKEFDVHFTTINDIKMRKTWK